MEWVVDVHRKVLKWLERHHEVEECVNEVVEELKKNPYIGKPLRGRRGLWRIRVGDIRIIYSIDKSTKTIRIWKIGYRESVYEEL